MKSIKDAGISGQTKVLVRGDLDVPLKNGEVVDTFRIDHLLPTLNFLKVKGAQIIICGKIGRPEGKYVEELSTKNLKSYFDNKLGNNYTLLENLRFDPREENNSEEFAKELSDQADMFVNDSFAVSHREHASIVGIPKFLPSFAGLRLMEEVGNLERLIKNPNKPLIAVIGGAKIETKKPVVAKFLKIADRVLVGGRIGLDWDEATPENLLLPLDYAEDDKDIGSKTITLFEKEISKAQTIIWSGPMGMFEDARFEEGTKRVGRAIVDSNAFSVVGGGDTIAALNKYSLFDGIGFVSTGGGAMLEFLVKGNLPGLKALGYNG